MIDASERDEGEESVEPPVDPSDDRRPYEPPRIMKKRSVNRATLFTAMTVSAVGVAMMG